MSGTRPMNDRTYVVTGALGSIGEAITFQLAATGGRVVLVVRDIERGAALAQRVSAATKNTRIEVVACDLGSLASIRRAAAELTRRFPCIDVLINNAAAYSRERRTTSDGFELQLGINHLGHFLLTNLLEAPLAASGKGRVVVVAMPSKAQILLDDLMLEQGYDGMKAYAMSKAANLHFARELAERWAGRITVNALHPGMVRTTLIAEAPLPVRIVFAIAASSPEKGAQTPVHLATAPELDGVTGRFFVKRKEVAWPKGSDDPETRRRLWDASARLVGLQGGAAARAA